MKTLSILVVTLVTSGLVFLAVVGAAFLFTTEQTPVEATDTCDEITRYNGKLMCMVQLQAEDDNITIIKK